MQLRFLLLLLLTFALLGCTGAPPTTAAAADTASRFMAALSGRNADRVYAMLTAAAQEAMDQATVEKYLAERQVSAGGLGAPVERSPGWVQIPVRDLVITFGAERIRWPETSLTLHYEDGRWKVAWIEPLAAAAADAYQNGRYTEALALGRSMSAVNPFSYRGDLEQHYAYKELRKPREAEALLMRAREKATPAELPAVLDALARFRLSLGQARDALSLAQSALEAAAPYAPDLYSRRWQADVEVVQARALAALGDREGAETALKKAEERDPQNPSAMVFRYQLTRPAPNGAGPAPAPSRNGTTGSR